MYQVSHGRLCQYTVQIRRTAHYLLALASDVQLPLAFASALDDGSWVREAQAQSTHAVALGREVMVRDTEIVRLNEEMNQAQDSYAKAQREVVVRDAEIVRLNEEMNQAQDSYAKAQREVVVRDAEIVRLNEEMNQAQDSYAKAQREVVVRDAEIVRLNEDLAHGAQERALLDEELSLTKGSVSALRCEVTHLHALIDERARHLEEIFTSTSWKITKPVRRIGQATAWLRRDLRAILTVAPTPPCVQAHKERIRILFVDWMVPTPDQDSGSMDLWHQLGIFHTLGYDVSFMPVVERPSDARYMDALRLAGVGLLVSEAGLSPESLLEEKANLFDLVFLNRIHVAGRFLAHVRRCAPNARIVFNTVDLHFLREEREAALEGSQDKAQTAAQRRQDELRCVADADATIVLSAEEGRLLSELAPRSTICVIPFARVTSGTVAPFKERTGILFVGGFLHAPNVDAVHWLVEDIWPKVRRSLPGVMLDIVGSNAPSEIWRLDSPDKGIRMRGFAQYLDPILSRTRLTVAPLRFGAGIKGKVVMSLAAGVPCVATLVASEGMGLTDGENILIGQSAEELAARIVQVHEDSTLWDHLSKGGQKVAHECYSLERIGQLFLGFIRSVGVGVPDDAEKKLVGIQPIPLDIVK